MSSNKPYNSWDAVQKRAAEVEACRAYIADSAEETCARVPRYLPAFDSAMRAMPNHIARSSIYAPVALGKKKIHKGDLMISRSDAKIWFWGEQLDEPQADVWMQVMYLAGKKPLGDPVTITRSKLLQAIDRQTGNTQYKWLKRSIEALMAAMLKIETSVNGKAKLNIGKDGALHFIDSFDYDDKVNSYIFRIDPRWADMYNNSEYALIDWKKRMSIKRAQHMAKTLQRLVATSSDPVQRHQIKWLKDKLKYDGRMDAFQKALTRTMNELERVGIISNSRIELSTKGVLQATWSKR